MKCFYHLSFPIISRFKYFFCSYIFLTYFFPISPLRFPYSLSSQLSLLVPVFYTLFLSSQRALPNTQTMLDLLYSTRSVIITLFAKWLFNHSLKDFFTHFCAYQLCAFLRNISWHSYVKSNCMFILKNIGSLHHIFNFIYINDHLQLYSH